MTATSSRYAYEGTETTEESIVRDGGFTDLTGSQQSRKIVTTANAQWLRPFKAESYSTWNPTTGADVDVTVYGVVAYTDVLPNNDDIWIEVEYLGDSLSTLGSIVHTTKSNLLATNAAVAADGSSWSDRSIQFDASTQVDHSLSSDGLTVTRISGVFSAGGVKSLAYRSTGKYYMEFTQTALTNSGSGANTVGLMLSTATYVQFRGGSEGFMVANGGSVWGNNVSGSIDLGTGVLGTVICVAVDLDAHLAWARFNGGTWNLLGVGAPGNPATGVAGVTIAAGEYSPAVATNTSATLGDAVTANFGATAYAYTPPAGFDDWPLVLTPFKLTTTLDSPQPGLAGLIEARVRVGKASATYYIDPQIELTPAGPSVPFEPVEVLPTWDALTATAVTLSGGNLVATNTGTTSTDQGVRFASTLRQTSGKYYFEATWTNVTGGDNRSVGIGTTASTYTSMGNGGTTGISLYKTGSAWSNGISILSWTGWFTGEVMAVAVDLDNRRLWYRDATGGNWNNSGTANPATNVGGLTIPAGTMVPFCVFGGAFGVAGGINTVNFGASAFTGTVPSGFTSGWPSGFTSEADPYKSERYTYEGTETTETSIVRTGGAADPTGQAQSRKIVTTANAQWLRPFKAEPYAIWNDVVDADVDVTVCGIVNSGAVPNNDDIWMEVEYLALGVSTTTFDAQRTSEIVLSNGDLTVLHNGVATNQGALSTAYRSGGKCYFEATLQDWISSFERIGVISSAWAGVVFSSSQFNLFGTGLTLAANVGTSVVTSNGITTAMELPFVVAGDVVCCAIDLDTRLAWFRINNGNWNGNASANPATGVGGATMATGVSFAPIMMFPGASQTNDKATYNFGASAYAYTPPSGFGDWIAPDAPLGKIVHTTKSNLLAANAAVDADGSSWTAPVRVNSTAYAVGDAVTVASNPGLVFFCTVAGTSAAAEPVGDTTWSTTDKHADIVLSNGDLTAARVGTTGAVGVRSINAQNGGNGRSYFEAVWNVTPPAGNTWVGVCTSGVALSGSTSNWVFIMGSSGVVQRNGINVGVALGALTGGTVVCFALDRVNNMLWVRLGSGDWNASPTADPTTNTEGILLTVAIGTTVAAYVGCTHDDATTSLTINFGATAFVQVVPDDFVAWNDLVDYPTVDEGDYVNDGTAVFRAGYKLKLTTTLDSPQPGQPGYIHTRVKVGKASATYYIDPQITLS